MIIMIDNYDSFTYNLYQYIGEINPDIEVYRNDKITVEDVIEKKPSHIVISPGPGYPDKAGICIDLIKSTGDIPVLGVCLGHQAVGAAFGANIIHAPRLMHGKGDTVAISSACPIFRDMGVSAQVGRYHSLVIDEDTLPAELEITARSDDGCIMGVMHKTRPVYGIQFHPESVLTPCGKKLIENFLGI